VLRSRVASSVQTRTRVLGPVQVFTGRHCRDGRVARSRPDPSPAPSERCRAGLARRKQRWPAGTATLPREANCLRFQPSRSCHEAHATPARQAPRAPDSRGLTLTGASRREETRRSPTTTRRGASATHGYCGSSSRPRVWESYLRTVCAAATGAARHPPRTCRGVQAEIRDLVSVAEPPGALGDGAGGFRPRGEEPAAGRTTRSARLRENVEAKEKVRALF